MGHTTSEQLLMISLQWRRTNCRAWDERRWWQICSLSIDVPDCLSVQARPSDQFCALYTDGSCWYGDTPEAAVASWAIIFDHCVNQDSQIEIATNWSCPNTWPSSLQFLKAGGVPGRQSNDRAELFAIFIALTVASKIHIFSDSKYALGVLDDIVNSTICLRELANRANWDIICKIVAAVGTRGNTSVDAR